MPFMMRALVIDASDQRLDLRVVETLIERASNSYRTVEELSQVTAGRMRALVSGLYQVRSKTANLRSEEVFKIDGEKIHLG